MNLRRWATLARKAVHRPPRFVVRRAAEEIRRQAYRPWGRLRPLLLTDRALLAATRARSIDELWTRLATVAFPIPAERTHAYVRSFSARWSEAVPAIVADADRICGHEFDLLGSGPVHFGSKLPWQDDFKAGRRWPLRYSADIDYNELDLSSDVKVPWELSRCQHFARLGEAYWLTGDERYAREFVDESTDWIAANPWTRGVNWACTMDVALRAISWIWGLRFFGKADACRSPEFRSAFLRSLFLHGEYVAAHVEISDVNGNHYLVDGVGLVFLGLIFRGAPAADRWLIAGRQIVLEEIERQVWPDGVDFEQSTAYHRLVLEAFLTAYVCLRQGGEPIPPAAWSRLERMLEFVAAYTKPDGRAPLIGDADDGRIQKLGIQELNDHRYLLSTGAVLFERSDFKAAAGRFWDDSFWLLGPDGVERFDAIPAGQRASSAAFPEGGFYVMHDDDAHVIIDCGEVGMRGRGGHGHNDILSFELFLNGMNVVTDCGAYLYTASREWRNRFRSTAFHNSVQVDGEELNRFVHQDDLWRLHDDARPMDVVWKTASGFDYFRGAHDGYARMASPVVHVREVLLDRQRKRVVVRDRLNGAETHRLVWRFHLDPALSANIEGAGIRMRTDRGQAWLQLICPSSDIRLRLESGWVSRSYGTKTENTVIVLECEREIPMTLAYCFAAKSHSAADLNEALATLEAAA